MQVTITDQWMVSAQWNRMAISFHGFKETESLCNALAVLFFDYVGKLCFSN